MEKERVARWIDHLSDPNALVRQTAIRWLGRWGGSQVVLPLVERLTDASSHVRWEAIRALARVGDGRALPALRALARPWSDEPDFIREAAAEAVACITARMSAVTGRELAVVPLPPRCPEADGSRALTFAEEGGMGREAEGRPAEESGEEGPEEGASGRGCDGRR